VVIPLERLGDYSDGIERVNIELSIANKLALLDALDEYFQGELPLAQHGETLPAPEFLGDRREARASCSEDARALAVFVDQLDLPVEQARRRYGAGACRGDHAGRTVFSLLQDHSVRVSWKDEVRAELQQLFDAWCSAASSKAATRFTSACSGRVFVRCTCMPATAMCTPTSRSTPTTRLLRQANAAVARIMRLAKSWTG